MVQQASPLPSVDSVLIDDLRSGTLVDLGRWGLPHEPTRTKHWTQAPMS